MQDLVRQNGIFHSSQEDQNHYHTNVERQIECQKTRIPEKTNGELDDQPKNHINKASGEEASSIKLLVQHRSENHLCRSTHYFFPKSTSITLGISLFSIVSCYECVVSFTIVNRCLLSKHETCKTFPGLTNQSCFGKLSKMGLTTFLAQERYIGKQLS